MAFIEPHYDSTLHPIIFHLDGEQIDALLEWFDAPADDDTPEPVTAAFGRLHQTLISASHTDADAHIRRDDDGKVKIGTIQIDTTSRWRVDLTAGNVASQGEARALARVLADWAEGAKP